MNFLLKNKFVVLASCFSLLLILTAVWSQYRWDYYTYKIEQKQVREIEERNEAIRKNIEISKKERTQKLNEILAHKKSRGFAGNVYERGGKFVVTDTGVFLDEAFQENLIEGADPLTFRQLENIGYIDSNYYALDKNNVYYLDRKIEGADPDTFEVVQPDNPGKGFYAAEYAKDKKSVYWLGFKIKGIDPMGFSLSQNHECILSGLAYKKCGEEVVYDYGVFQKPERNNSDEVREEKGIERVGYDYGIKDGEVYELYSNELVESLNIETLGRLYEFDEVTSDLIYEDDGLDDYLDILYDDDSIFWIDPSKDALNPELVDMGEVDLESFRIISFGYDGYSFDKNHVYYKGRNISDR